MRRFTIQTLIDITETRQYRHTDGDSVAKLQQQNFSTLMQTIGMRVNPLYESAPRVNTLDVKDLYFGSKFSGSHKVWIFEFGIEYEGGFADSQGNQTGLLVEDLNFVPIITDLTETAEINPAVFDTKSGQDRNTVIVIDSINNTARQ
jgi:hypothetical protein